MIYYKEVNNRELCYHIVSSVKPMQSINPKVSKTIIERE